MTTVLTNPFEAFEKALLTILKNNGTLTTAAGGTYVYNSIAPSGAPNKFVVFQNQTAVTGRTMPLQEQEDLLYLVKAVVGGEYQVEVGSAIFTAIDRVLDNKPLDTTSDGYLNVSLYRETAVKYADNTGFWHIGGLYRAKLERQ